MIKIHWTHLAIILALVVGIFLGSQMQMTPGLALAADTNNTSNPNIAMTIYNNVVYIARGNSLYAMWVVDHPYLKNQKLFLPAGMTDIDKSYSTTTSVATPTANFGIPVVKPMK